MNFRGHLICGVLVGAGVAEGASRLGFIPPGDTTLWAGVAGTGVFFSLFPDLDTSSVPQRWFFRLVFAGLIYLGWIGRYELATLVGIVSLLPLLDHHRGWTHWKISPLVVPLALGALYEYWRVRHSIWATFSWENVRQVLQEHPVFLVACMAGWYAHLLLDGRFKIFPTDRDHH